MRRKTRIPQLLAVTVFPAVLGIAALSVDVEAQAQPATLTAVRDLLVDATTADLSTQVTRLLATKNGDIVAHQLTDVRYFSSTGVPFVFGRAGDGPGEFRNSLNYGTVGDTVWVSDPRHTRTTFIGPDRKIIRMTQHPTSISKEGSAPPANPRRLIPYPFAVYGDGSILYSVSLPASGPLPDWAGSAKPSQSLLVHASVDGVFKKIVAVNPPNGRCGILFETATGPRANSFIPFCQDPYRAISADGERIAIAQWDTATTARPSYRLVVLNAQGDTTIARDYAYSPVPIPSAAIDSFIKVRVDQLQNTPEVIAAYKRIPRPKNYPPLRAIMIGRDKTIWLEMRAPAGPRLWHVLNARGNHTATVRVPFDVTITTADMTTLWGLQTDGDGLQSIMRFKLNR